MNELDPKNKINFRLNLKIEETVLLFAFIFLLLLSWLNPSFSPNHYCILVDNKAYYTNDLRGNSFNETETQFSDIVYYDETQDIKMALVGKQVSNVECQIYFEFMENGDE